MAESEKFLFTPEEILETETLIAELPAEDLKSNSSVPIAILCNEADAQADHLDNDADALKRMRINPTKLAYDIRITSAILRKREINWDRARIKNSKDEDEWLTIKPGSYTTRNNWLDFLDFACEEMGDSEGSKIIDEIKEGSGDADMVMDIGKIAQFFDEKVELVDAYEISTEEILEVHELYGTLTRLMGNTTADRQRVKVEQELRNRALTHLSNLIRRARRAGRIVFKRDPKALERYRSDYTHAAYLRTKKKKAEEKIKEAEKAKSNVE